MIKFLCDCQLTIVTEFDEENDNIVDEKVETFRKGEEVEAVILDADAENKYVDLEFFCGVAFCVQRDLFEVISE